MFWQADIRDTVITEPRVIRHVRGMSKRPPSPRARAFVSWMKERGTNTRQVALKSGVSYNTLASFVQGDTQSLKGENEERITTAYGVAASEIFEGAAPAVLRVPIISWVQAGRFVDPETQLPRETETIELSGLEPGDYFATRVKGDSMDRVSPEGSMILVNRAERDPIRGRRYVFARGGETTYKRFENDPVLRLEPESLNPANRPIYPRDNEQWQVVGRVRLSMTEL